MPSIKTRMQTQIGKVNGQKVTMHRMASLIYSEGGIIGFYRGIAAPLLSLVVLNTMTFSAYASLKEKYGVSKGTTSFGLGENLRVAAAAASIGPIAALISTPFELVKTQMQLSIKLDQTSSAGKHHKITRSSFVQAFQLVRAYGIRALYIGHGINTAREMLFLATYFTVYENSKVFFTSVLSSAIAVPFAGGISGAAGWLISFPLDCVKANIQGKPIHLGHQLSALTTAKDLLKAKGMLGLYSGLLPSLARAFLVSSSRFSAYEFSMWLLK